MRNRPARSVWIRAAAYFIIFLFLLVLNRWSLYIADDFGYLFNFYDRTRIESLSQIILSMRAHRYKMNGRLVAHALVQMFGMWPMWVFDIVNALMFALQIALIYRISRGNQRDRAAVPVAAFCLVWLYCPTFGQVNLWQDGACNYLWSVVLALLFMVPYAEAFLHYRWTTKWWDKAGFLCLAFGMGAYSETASAAAIGMAVLMALLIRLYNRQKVQPLLVWGLAIAVLGYLSIYTAPAQLNGKSAEMSVQVLLDNIATASIMYWKICGVLLCGLVVLAVLNLWKKGDPRQMLLAGVFVLGSFAANYIMVFASYYTSRSAIGAFVFLLVGDLTLLFPMLEKPALRRAFAAALVLLALITVPALVTGTQDVARTYRIMRSNEEHLTQCSQQGIQVAQIQSFSAETPYSEAYGLVYVDLEDPENYPNRHMARLYGLDSVVGIPAE